MPRPLAIVALGLTGAVAVAAVVLVTRSGERAEDAGDGVDVELSTVEIEQRDLTTYDETEATLGFTTSVTVSSPVAGTVTSILPTGATVDAGTVVASVDGSPVVAMIGDVPAYRDLSTSSSPGVDVRQLETNLVMLGFDPDGGIEIDTDYDSATSDAVELWEDSLGLDGDGEVAQSEIVYVPGRLLVDTVSVDVGGAAASGSALLVARQAERRFVVPATVGDGGVVDRIAAAGTPVATGTVLFWQSGTPVVAVEGDTSALPALARDLSVGVDDGADVKLLEQMLAADGFDAGGFMVVDDHFDAGTAVAVGQWWQSLGLPEPVPDDVVVPAGSFVIVPAGLFTGSPVVADGTVLASDGAALDLTSAARIVSTTAPIGDPTFALGASIDVLFPDGTVEPGTVVAVGNAATNTTDVPGATPSVTIDLHVDQIPESVDSFVQIPVTLRVVAESEADAFVVPVTGLVALAEGGYAVEVSDGTDTSGAALSHLIAVTPGLFADGFVSITGADVATGLPVVVPA